MLALLRLRRLDAESRRCVHVSRGTYSVEFNLLKVTRPECQMAISGVGVEKVGTNQLIFMRSVWQWEMFSSIV